MKGKQCSDIKFDENRNVGGENKKNKKVLGPQL